MKKIIYLIVMLLSLLPVSSIAAISAYHVANDTCGKYIDIISTSVQAKEVYSWWLAGFITGTNMEKNRSLSTDSAAHELWLKNYCEEHPLENFVSAAEKLNIQLDKKSIKIWPNE